MVDLRLGALALVVLLSGCATCTRGQVVEVRSIPEQADVFVDGEHVGVTPARLTLGRERDHSVFVKKDEYVPELVVVETQATPEGVAFLTPWEIEVRLSPRDTDLLDRDVIVETDEEP